MTAQDGSLDIYMIAIGGTGMAPLACLLQDLGHRVSGSDGPVYPPMSTLLEGVGIDPLVGYRREHVPDCDLVVVGNTIRTDNPEVERARELGLPLVSMPEAVRRFLLAGRRSLVVSGTHGKTTTSSLAAWVLTHSEHDPGYLIGGIPANLNKSFAVGTGSWFVIEGDEYGCSFFDRGPKFLHYQPQSLILTSVEYDHADLYPDHQTLLRKYDQLVELLPRDGLLIACGDSEDVREVAAKASCDTVFYGLSADNDISPLGELELTADGVRMTVDDREFGPTDLQLSVPGRHNASNALAVWAALRAAGVGVEQIQAALASFRGAKRRLEELGTFGGTTVIDDFAHHPTAVEASLGALKARSPDRRLIAAFEPRTLSAGRTMFFDAYVQAFAVADAVFLAPVFHSGRLSSEECLDLSLLCERLESRAGIIARSPQSIDQLQNELLAIVQPGDVIVTMSSGAFEGLPRRLATALAEGDRV